MRYLFCSSTKTDNKVAAKTISNLDYTLGERIPRHVGLNAIEHNHVAGTFGVPNDHELIFRPPNNAFPIFIDELFGALLGEIKKRIWVNVGNN